MYAPLFLALLLSKVLPGERFWLQSCSILEEDVFVIRRTLETAEANLAKVRGLNRDYFVLNGDIAAMAEMEELRAEKKRKVA